MSRDYFFDVNRRFKCPLCGEYLIPKPRRDQPENMKLIHPAKKCCERSRRVYYGPMIEFEQIPKKFQ